MVRTTVFSKTILMQRTDFQNIGLRTTTFSKRGEHFLTITYASNCTLYFGACRVYVWCIYSAFKVHVRFFGAYVDSFVYGTNHLLCTIKKRRTKSKFNATPPRKL